MTGIYHYQRLEELEAAGKSAESNVGAEELAALKAELEREQKGRSELDEQVFKFFESYFSARGLFLYL